MTTPSTALTAAAATYKTEHAKLAPLEAAWQRAHDAAYDQQGLPTDAPGAYSQHMTALNALEEQRQTVQQAGVALCLAALKTGD